jgi:hypothetical protein
MSASETTFIDPGKWPRLIVAGAPVTEAQADEILIRTAALYYLHCNDHEWDHIVARIVFRDERAAEHDFPFQRALKRAEELRNLNLEYLDNYRISSSWIGGPRGWCDWDGHIGTANYNIGKWPSIEEVGSEWSQIAAAFPYLDLTAQLISDGTADQVCGQWRVKNGVATEEPPGALLAQHEPHATPVDRFVEQLFNPGSERGVSPERLQQAVARVEAKIATATQGDQ